MNDIWEKQRWVEKLYLWKRLVHHLEFGITQPDKRQQIVQSKKNAFDLLKVLEPAYNEIEKILKNKDYEIIINIWYTGPTGFIISSETLSRLTKICKHLYIICFEEEDAV